MSGNRPEARPLSLDVLDHYQVQAIERISESLLSALEHLERLPPPLGPGENDLDPFRASNSFFLSGEGGGGKTTVYLSLKDALERDDMNPDPKKFAKLSRLKSKAKQLVWLEHLDLEPQPEVGNFLAAVLVRIEAQIGKAIHADRKRRPGLLERGAEDALQEFERLQRDVVLAWEGNIPQRAEHLDPDVYSSEVLHAAGASLQVNPRLKRALRGILAEDYRDAKQLFILPIDDFYLHPASSLKLLRLLRMISVPYLFTLILGDIFAVEELFYQDVLGKLVALAGEQSLRVLPRQREILTATATDLTAHSLRKLIPIGQRFRLPVMHQLAALEFTPARLDPPALRSATSSEYRYTLRDLLGLLPVKVPLVTPVSYGKARTEIPSLLEFLMLRKKDEETNNDNYYTYSGLAVLDLPPREVVDLWYSIVQH